ncbi:MAG: DUF5682 family protein [Phycisphaerales bacterium]
MSGKVTALGIRHHGPGSARMVARALKELKPDAVLIEGPPDAAELLPLAGLKGMKPPVALLVYEPDTPSNAAYYPFAEFSPEWQAIRWGLASKAEVRFIDLPCANQALGTDKSELSEEADDPSQESDAHSSVLNPPSAPADPLDALALAAGFSDGEAWWGKLIEERHADDDPIGLFDAIREAMAQARESMAARSPQPSDRSPAANPAREAHMRRCIRAAVKEGFERIAVVCGAWHAPVLTAEALKKHPAKADDELLKGLPRRKIAATWVPWTYDRLCLDSGYGAGVASPGWYDHLWVHHERVAERWLTRVARLLRDEDLDASPASVIESVRLADSLAALRGRKIAGLEELGEATLSILCHGNPLPMRIIERNLIVGQRLGEVPEDAPTVPLQRDLAAQQKSLRMKVSADDALLDLDQRKDTDLARSRLLHRLTILAIPWGVLEQNQRQRDSTFHEIWKLQWKPELAVAVIEAARWGNTVAAAAAACVADKAASASNLVELTAMLDDVMLADLPRAVERLVSRIQAMSAVSADVGHLMEALPPLARVLRYGNVRKTDAALVEPLVAGLLARICAGLLPACGSLDDDAAGQMRQRIDGVHGALANLDRTDFSDAWTDALRKVGDADINGLLAGRAWRLLLDTGAEAPEAAAGRLSLALSAGNDPEKASAWLEGFLAGSGLVLVHDDRLLGIVDQWVAGLSHETFERVCPIARRTFSTFEKPARRQIGENLKRGTSVPATPEAASDDYDPARGALVEPVLRLILGEHLS